MFSKWMHIRLRNTENDNCGLLKDGQLTYENCNNLHNFLCNVQDTTAPSLASITDSPSNLPQSNPTNNPSVSTLEINTENHQILLCINHHLVHHFNQQCQIQIIHLKRYV